MRRSARWRRIDNFTFETQRGQGHYVCTVYYYDYYLGVTRGPNLLRIPPFSEVANAVGAAIASVAGEVDVIEILEGKSLPETIERLKAQAISNAVKAGADPNTTRLVEVNVLPIQVIYVFCFLYRLQLTYNT